MDKVSAANWCSFCLFLEKMSSCKPGVPGDSKKIFINQELNSKLYSVYTDTKF